MTSRHGGWAPLATLANPNGGLEDCRDPETPCDFEVDFKKPGGTMGWWVEKNIVVDAA